MQECTEERYDEMLEMLPPAMWLATGFRAMKAGRWRTILVRRFRTMCGWIFILIFFRLFDRFLVAFGVLHGPRANWKGFLRLSLVTCPVALYPATSDSEKVSFNQINRKRPPHQIREG
jgi:hypothetical protein